MAIMDFMRRHMYELALLVIMVGVILIIFILGWGGDIFQEIVDGIRGTMPS